MGFWTSQYPKDKHIVIVGAGYGGTTFGKQLLKRRANFTVIDQRSFMHDNILAAHAAVQPGFAQKTIIPLQSVFGKRFKEGQVTKIDPIKKSIRTSSGEEVQYDSLVIATGTRGPFPVKLEQQSAEEATQQYNQITQKMKGSEKIAVIGGGAAGVEMAAEIADLYPQKQVTLINSTKQILNYNFITELFRNNVSKFLTSKLGIKLLSDVKVVNSGQRSGQLLTSSGERIDTDLAVHCTGLQVNSDAYSCSLVKAMTKTGELRVNPYFEVEGFQDVYAIGDCCHTGEAKMAVIAQEHSKHLAKNLALRFSGKHQIPYKPNRHPVLMKISLGQHFSDILFR